MKNENSKIIVSFSEELKGKQAKPIQIRSGELLAMEFAKGQKKTAKRELIINQ